jgi:hypothetical protein
MKKSCSGMRWEKVVLLLYSTKVHINCPSQKTVPGCTGDVTNGQLNAYSCFMEGYSHLFLHLHYLVC